ncbi:MAG TPA: hypothetical protein VIN07_14665 [Flavipsychrobacter sp.]
MALPLSFFAIAMSFFALGMSYFSKAKKMPDSTTGEAAAKKKVNDTGIAFLVMAISFIPLAVTFAVR